MNAPFLWLGAAVCWATFALALSMALGRGRRGLLRGGVAVGLVLTIAFLTYQLLARVSLGELSFATPAVAGGTMYLRTASHLYSLGGK